MAITRLKVGLVCFFLLGALSSFADALPGKAQQQEEDPCQHRDRPIYCYTVTSCFLFLCNSTMFYREEGTGSGGGSGGSTSGGDDEDGWAQCAYSCNNTFVNGHLWTECLAECDAEH